MPIRRCNACVIYHSQSSLHLSLKSSILSVTLHPCEGDGGFLLEPVQREAHLPRFSLQTIHLQAHLAQPVGESFRLIFCLLHAVRYGVLLEREVREALSRRAGAVFETEILGGCLAVVLTPFPEIYRS